MSKFLRITKDRHVENRGALKLVRRALEELPGQTLTRFSWNVISKITDPDISKMDFDKNWYW